MLSSEFSHELGSLIRSLEQKVRLEPSLITPVSAPIPTLDHIERSIVTLIALYLSLKEAQRP